MFEGGHTINNLLPKALYCPRESGPAAYTRVGPERKWYVCRDDPALKANAVPLAVHIPSSRVHSAATRLALCKAEFGSPGPKATSDPPLHPGCHRFICLKHARGEG